MKITTINTIELSSLCDNNCQYCPAQEQGKHRNVGLMKEHVFKKAIDWVQYFCKQGTQRELNLFGVGEPTLHPHLVEYVKYARNRLPFKQDLHLNTNGNRMTAELAKDLKKAGITAIDITGHNHYQTAKTIQMFRKFGINGQLSYDFVTAPNNWAGQVDWFKPTYYKENRSTNICPWLSRGQIMVMSNGDITTCCIDAFASAVFGTVEDDLPHLEFDSHELCRTCHHLTPAEYEILNNDNPYHVQTMGMRPNPCSVMIENNT